ncbi:hypothetical protein JOE33_000182 [Pseudomonas sp. PvP027]|nr:hypothetical protein [Pseudomonas sp. PvP027]PBQ00431.1 hypothetical protein CCL24_02660 [Pseudomonas congelans]
MRLVMTRRSFVSVRTVDLIVIGMFTQNRCNLGVMLQLIEFCFEPLFRPFVLPLQLLTQPPLHVARYPGATAAFGMKNQCCRNSTHTHQATLDNFSSSDKYFTLIHINDYITR